MHEYFYTLKSTYLKTSVSAAYKIGMTDEWLDTKLLEFQR